MKISFKCQVGLGTMKGSQVTGGWIEVLDCCVSPGTYKWLLLHYRELEYTPACHRYVKRHGLECVFVCRRRFGIIAF